MSPDVAFGSADLAEQSSTSLVCLNWCKYLIYSFNNKCHLFVCGGPPHFNVLFSVLRTEDEVILGSVKTLDSRPKQSKPNHISVDATFECEAQTPWVHTPMMQSTLPAPASLQPAADRQSRMPWLLDWSPFVCGTDAEQTLHSRCVDVEASGRRYTVIKNSVIACGLFPSSLPVSSLSFLSLSTINPSSLALFSVV